MTKSKGWKLEESRSASLPAFPFHFGTSLHSHDRLAHVLFGSLEIGLQIL